VTTYFKKKSDWLKTKDFQERYGGSDEKQSARYGLPEKVEFCTRCVISNQRPNSAVEYSHTEQSKKKTIAFSAEGVCDACALAEKKKATIDWGQREQELEALCEKFRGRGEKYDCLVPGSGGKDSFYAAHKLKYKYGMNPLTVTWAPHLYTDWGWRNFQAWLNAGFDNYLVTPNPRVHRLLTRLAVETLFHPFQPFMFGQKALAPKMARLFNIPLVFYGENEAEYGNPIEGTGSAQRDWEYFTSLDNSNVYLGGTSIEALKAEFGVSHIDLDLYMPMNLELLTESDLQVHYLGYYLPWHPQGAYYYAVEHGDFQASPERTPGTYSKYNSIDDKIDDFHYYTTYIKFGIGRATYDASQEIRNEEITQEEGIALVRKFDGEFPYRFAEEVFQYLSIPEDEFPIASSRFEQPVVDHDYFQDLSDSFRSPHLWKKKEGEWALRRDIWHDFNDA
jgi:N-acetyl sugar amidotransferase